MQQYSAQCSSIQYSVQQYSVKCNSKQYSMQQYCVKCNTILGKEYASYQAALYNLGLEKLEARRVSLSTKFAKKAFK